MKKVRIIGGGGNRGSTVVKVLRYKSEGRWFNSRWCHLEFFIDNPSARTMTLGSTQPLTEMSIPGVFPGVKGGRCLRLTTMPPSWAVVMKSGNLKVLCYKSQGRWFDSSWCHWNFSLTILLLAL